METAAEVLKRDGSNKSQKSSKTLSNGKSKQFKPETPQGGKAECRHCGGMGFYIPDVPPIDPTFGRAVRCVCQAATDALKDKDKLMQMSQLGQLKACTFEAFAPTGHMLSPDKQRNLKLAYDNCRHFAAEPAGWLIIKGGYGCGKTHLAAAIANDQLERGQPVMFINTPDLLDHLRSTYSPTSYVSYDERFDQIRNTPLLILDDLGTQSNTEWAQEKLYQIFNYRYTAKLPTVVTTNQELESFEPRIQSRMRDLNFVHVLHIAAPDFRRGGTGVDQSSELSSLELHGDKTFESFKLRENELSHTLAENLGRALETALNFSENPRDWLVINSVGFGNGKTHLAAAIANRMAQNGEEVLFVMVPDLLDHLRASFNPSATTRLDTRFNEVKKASLLVLDDLGTESATAWAREKLYQLFNYRYNARLPTIITSATPIEELDPRLSARMLDGSRCTFFVLDAPSYRGNNGKKRRYKRKG